MHWGGKSRDYKFHLISLIIFKQLDAIHSNFQSSIILRSFLKWLLIELNVDTWVWFFWTFVTPDPC